MCNPPQKGRAHQTQIPLKHHLNWRSSPQGKIRPVKISTKFWKPPGGTIKKGGKPGEKNLNPLGEF